MIREIDIKVYYELDVNEDEYSDIITPPNTIVEDRVYDKMCDIFADDEGFQGLRVDCTDTFDNLEEKRDKLSRFVGCHPDQMKPWEP